MGLPVVAIVGRPNVGKSTLMNRVVGRQEAIVEERPGVTRDRKELEAEWAGRRFVLVDTGGWLASGEVIDEQVSRQAERAMAAADVLLLVVDTEIGVTEEDARVAAVVRRIDRPVLVVANKVDGDSRDLDVWEFARLGLGDPHPVSALHGRGTGDLLDAVVARLPEAASDGTAAGTMPGRGTDDDAEDGTDDGEAGGGRRATRAEQDMPSVAIVGRPNVGKSTLFNRLIGDERSVVHDMPGTTRDTIDTVIETPSGRIRLLDTAGMRRRSRIHEGTEYYSLVRALRAVDAADVAILVIDATEGVAHQDQRLAERIDAAGSPIVLLMNKWELLDAEQRADVRAQVVDRLHFLPEAPVVTGSALTGKAIHKLLPALDAAMEGYRLRVPTRELNTVIQTAQAAHPSPSGRVLYATQGATDPPTITLFATRELPRTYLRYLERKIREHFEFGNTPVKLRVRRRSG